MITLTPLITPLRGFWRVPGDKSISHRAVILAAMAQGTSRLRGVLCAADVMSTVDIVRHLGANVREGGSEFIIDGWGVRPNSYLSALDCGNSGTTMRLLTGVLAAVSDCYTLNGDASLRGRPMRRLAFPLQQMGAEVRLSAVGTAPIVVAGTELSGITYHMPVASAQLKSCLLLAGVQAQGKTVIRGDNGSRDHTERMLEALGANIAYTNSEVRLAGSYKWSGFDCEIPGDLSSAAFVIALALCLPGSEIVIEGVGLNPTRLGFYRLLQRMGANLSWDIIGWSLGEPWGSLQVRHSSLHGIEVSEEDVPSCLDELVLLAVVAAQAEGRTEVRGAQELRVKECDRLKATALELGKMGVNIKPTEQGWVIGGPTQWREATVDTWNDHRLEMSLAVAASIGSSRKTFINNTGWNKISYPSFWNLLCDLHCGNFSKI